MLYGNQALSFVMRVVDAIVTVIGLVLLLRLLLLFFGANPNARFVQWTYATTADLMNPFVGIFPVWHLGGGYMLDLSVVFAMAAYGALGWLAVYVLSLFGLHPHPPRPITAEH